MIGGLDVVWSDMMVDDDGVSAASHTKVGEDCLEKHRSNVASGIGDIF